jgi:hypothetical protein
MKYTKFLRQVSQYKQILERIIYRKYNRISRNSENRYEHHNYQFVWPDGTECLSVCQFFLREMYVPEIFCGLPF